MAKGLLMSESSRLLFPISTIGELLTFFENEFLKKSVNGGGHLDEAEPNLGLLSIVLGSIEFSLTLGSTPMHGNSGSGGSAVNRRRGSKFPKKLLPSESVAVNGMNVNHDVTHDKLRETKHDFPPLDYDIVVGLYDKLEAIVRSNVNLDMYSHDKRIHGGTSRELVKNISDIFWNTLSRSYMSDKPHLQTLYSYLTVNKFDSFGLALAVVAAAQILGLSDVHLALSEDHTWVVIGDNETVEVTWHGKENEDKRGRPIESNFSWLYLKGFPVVCTRWTEITAIVAAINPCVSAIADSLELVLIQQKLLWKLYQHNHSHKYPMALSHLADMEEVSPTRDVNIREQLYEESIDSNVRYYKNMHVYPYIYYGGYLYRKQDFKGALKCWAGASDVISCYGHSRHDEEIYKEFLDISKDLIPSMMKICSAGFSANSPTRDPNCYANLLRFFDGICLWEELGRVPVVHIGWVKSWVSALGKFEATAKEGLKIFEASEGMCDDSMTIRGQSGSSILGFTDLNGNKGSSPTDPEPSLVRLYLRSFKMKNIKALLEKEKFVPAALTLQLTAQPAFLPGEMVENGSSSSGGQPIDRRSRGLKAKVRRDSASEESQPTSSKRTKGKPN